MNRFVCLFKQTNYDRPRNLPMAIGQRLPNNFISCWTRVGQKAKWTRPDNKGELFCLQHKDDVNESNRQLSLKLLQNSTLNDKKSESGAASDRYDFTAEEFSIKSFRKHSTHFFLMCYTRMMAEIYKSLKHVKESGQWVTPVGLESVLLLHTCRDSRIVQN